MKTQSNTSVSMVLKIVCEMLAKIPLTITFFSNFFSFLVVVKHAKKGVLFERKLFKVNLHLIYFESKSLLRCFHSLK
jgi:hypothetical protein